MSKKYNRNVYPAVVSVSAAEYNGGLGVLYLSGGSAKAVRTARLPAESVVRWRQCTEVCGTTGLLATHIRITSNRQRAEEEPIVKNNELQRMFCALEVLIFNVNFMLFLFPMNSTVTHFPNPAHSSNFVISI